MRTFPFITEFRPTITATISVKANTSPCPDNKEKDKKQEEKIPDIKRCGIDKKQIAENANSGESQ